MNHKERISEIYEYAIKMFNEHNLSGWSLELFKGSALGKCNEVTKTISVNYALVFFGQFENVKLTILHEIAHALAGNEHGHGPRWKYFCERIGAKPVACHDADDVDVEVMRELYKYEIAYKKPDGTLEPLNVFTGRKAADISSRLFFGRPETKGNLVYVENEKKSTPFKSVVLFKKP